MADSYLTVRGYGSGEYVEKKSRFIGSIAPVADVGEAEAFLAEVKAKNPGANHNVYAYLLRDGIHKRYSDDGEPQGTGGPPVLEMLEREGVVGVCCVVTRYFGGTLLGAGNLTRAYGKAARLALVDAGKAVMSPCKVLSLTVDYGLYGKVAYILPQYNIKTLDEAFTDAVTLTLLIRADRAERFAAEIREMSAGKTEPEVVEERFCEME